MTNPPTGRPVVLPAFVFAVIGLVVAAGASPALADSPGPGGQRNAKQAQQQHARAGSAEDQNGPEKKKKNGAATPGPVKQSSANGAQENGGSQPSGPHPDRKRDEKHRKADEKPGPTQDDRVDKRPSDPETDESPAPPSPATPDPAPAGVRALSATPGVNALLRTDAVARVAPPVGDALPERPADPGTVVEPAPVIRPVLGAAPAPAPPRRIPFVSSLDDPAFPALLLAALALFLAVFGRGDRRDPKLVEAVVDDRAQDVDFS